MSDPHEWLYWADDFDAHEVHEPVHLSVEEFVHETPKAWLLKIDGKKIWWPKSKAQFNQRDMELTVPVWLYYKKL